MKGDAPRPCKPTAAFPTLEASATFQVRSSAKGAYVLAERAYRTAILCISLARRV